MMPDRFFNQSVMTGIVGRDIDCVDVAVEEVIVIAIITAAVFFRILFRLIHILGAKADQVDGIYQ